MCGSETRLVYSGWGEALKGVCEGVRECVWYILSLMLSVQPGALVTVYIVVVVIFRCDVRTRTGAPVSFFLKNCVGENANDS